MVRACVFSNVKLGGLTSFIKKLFSFFLSLSKKNNPNQTKSLSSVSSFDLYTYLVTTQRVGKVFSHSKHISSKVQM